MAADVGIVCQRACLVFAAADQAHGFGGNELAGFIPGVLSADDGNGNLVAV